MTSRLVFRPAEGEDEPVEPARAVEMLDEPGRRGVVMSPDGVAVARANLTLDEAVALARRGGAS